MAFRKIIVGHDLREGGEDALALGRLIAAPGGAELVVAGVFPRGLLPRGFEARWRVREEEVAAEIERVAEAAGAKPEAFPASSPARGLHDLAEELGADLIVIGSSRHSELGRLIAGDVGAGLLQGAPCAVGLAPWGYGGQERHNVERVVVAFDGSDEARLALADAHELSRLLDARLELVGVVPPLPIPDPDLVDAAVAELRRLVEGAAPGGSAVTIVAGEPAEELARAASKPGDLLALGSRGYGPLKRVLLGSVSAALVSGASRCPLLVRPRADG